MDLVTQFMEYTSGMKSCALYRKWSGITMVAGAMERRVHAIVGHYTTYPNIYTMLVGPPNAGKGVIEVVQELWRDTTNDLGFPAFYAAGDDSTKAGLIDLLKNASQHHIGSGYDSHCLLLPVEEFSVFFAKSDPQLLSFLTKIWNAPPEFQEMKRKNGKMLTIKNPIMSALLGYQPALLKDIMMQHGADQGFLRRTILIWNEKPDKILLFEAPPPNEELKKDILRRLGEISVLFGEMQWDQAAKDFLQEWDWNDGPPRPTHPDLTNYIPNRTEHLLKLTIIASISESTSMLINLNHAKRALGWLLEAESLMPAIFDHVRGSSILDVMKRLDAFLTKEASLGIPLTDKLIYHWLIGNSDPSSFRGILDSMQNAGVLLRDPNGVWRVTGKVLRT